MATIRNFHLLRKITLVCLVGGFRFAQVSFDLYGIREYIAIRIFDRAQHEIILFLARLLPPDISFRVKLNSILNKWTRAREKSKKRQVACGKWQVASSISCVTLTRSGKGSEPTYVHEYTWFRNRKNADVSFSNHI